MTNLLKWSTPGRICAGGVFYDDRPQVLLRAAQAWRLCARSVIRSAQEDTDWAYRVLGARAARYRLAISRALLARARELVW